MTTAKKPCERTRVEAPISMLTNVSMLSSHPGRSFRICGIGPAEGDWLVA